jgi:hypothetical protein
MALVQFHTMLSPRLKHLHIVPGHHIDQYDQYILHKSIEM